MDESPAVRLLRENPRLFWGNAIAVLVRRGWRPPLPHEKIVEDLLEAMEKVDVPPARVLQQQAVLDLAGLTPKEMELVELIRLGVSNNEAAASLGVAPQTVKFHLTNVYRKLGIRNRTELAARLSG